jgi:hypothetical protein
MTNDLTQKFNQMVKNKFFKKLMLLLFCQIMPVKRGLQRHFKMKYNAFKKIEIATE